MDSAAALLPLNALPSVMENLPSAVSACSIVAPFCVAAKRNSCRNFVPTPSDCATSPSEPANSSDWLIAFVIVPTENDARNPAKAPPAKPASAPLIAPMPLPRPEKPLSIRPMRLLVSRSNDATAASALFRFDRRSSVVALTWISSFATSSAIGCPYSSCRFCSSSIAEKNSCGVAAQKSEGRQCNAVMAMPIRRRRGSSSSPSSSPSLPPIRYNPRSRP